MHLIDHGTMQRDAGFLITLPVESGIDDDRLRHAPRIITEILSQILLLAPDDITEHFIRPAHLSSDGLRIRIKKKFRAVEAQSAFGIVRTGNAETIQLPWTHIWQKHVPDVVGMFGDRDTNVFFSRLDVVEQARLKTFGIL